MRQLNNPLIKKKEDQLRQIMQDKKREISEI